MPNAPAPEPLNEQEKDAIEKRRAAVRATLACEDIYLSREDESAFSEMDRLRLSGTERIAYLERYFDATHGR